MFPTYVSFQIRLNHGQIGWISLQNEIQILHDLITSWKQQFSRNSSGYKTFAILETQMDMSWQHCFTDKKKQRLVEYAMLGLEAQWYT